MANHSTTRTGHLAAQVRRALNHSGHIQLRSVAVTPIPNGVQLGGVVPTYYLKQMAQSLALATEGVTSVVSHMEVQ